MKRFLSVILSITIAYGVMVIPAFSQQNIYGAYLQVLNAAVEEYGEFERIGYGYSTGVGYVKLIDFDNDGNSELLFCVGKKRSPREYDFDYEYYIYTYKNGKAVLVANDSMEAHCGTVNWEIRLYISRGGNVKLSKSRYEDIACESEYITFYEYDGDKWITYKDAFASVAVETGDGYYFDEYYIYGEKVSEAEYNNRLNSISGQGFIEINSYDFSGAYLEETGAGLSDGNYWYNSDGNELAEQITVKLNGIEIWFDQPPVIVNDRTLVPMRAIFEAMGCYVEWDDGMIDVYKDDENIMTLWVDDNEMWLPSGYTYLDVAPVIINDRTLVPVRAITESMGADVEWDESSRTVDIYYYDYFSVG